MTERGLHIHVHHAAEREGARALASSRTGSNLPATYAPWRAANSGNPLVVGSDAVSPAVLRDGYFLVNAKTWGLHPVAESRRKLLFSNTAVRFVELGSNGSF
jgi:hypothetical protein